MKRNLPYKKDRFKDVYNRNVGDEPTLGPDSTMSDFGKALNWYSYMFGTDAAKQFTMVYLEEQNYPKDKIKNISRQKEYEFLSTGWTCRIMSIGGKVPDVVKTRVLNKIEEFATKEPKKSYVGPTVSEAEDGEETISAEIIPFPVRKTLKRVSVVGDIDEKLDEFYKSNYKKFPFNFDSFLSQLSVTKDVATDALKFYKELYEEIKSASKGDVEGYNLTATQFKNYLEVLGNVLLSLSKISEKEVIKKTRKPRRKKVKTPAQLVGKVQFMQTDPDLKVTGLEPSAIIGSTQLWTYNTKYKILTNYIASDPTGFTIKGTTVYGFDETSSISKRLRKPMEVVPTVINTGKVGLKHLMDTIKTTMIKPTGRLNSDTLILRTVNNDNKGKTASYGGGIKLAA